MHLDKGPNDFLQNLEVKLVKDYNLVLYQEELMWQQKARADWLKYGDANSKFYHSLVKGKQRRKKINTLKKDDNSWCFDQKELEDMVFQFYRNLYSDDGVTVSLPKKLDWKLEATDVVKLTKEVDSNDVKKALFDMSPNKSPGFDGFPVGFFQKN